MPKFVGAAKKDDAKKALRQRPTLVLFFMTGCPHCEANQPAWEEAKSKAPAGTKIVEVDADATPEDEGVEGFPTMKLK
jgi:thioredoxin-like negative regulator of GroEL